MAAHHTPSCDLAGDDEVKDLAEVPGTQYWVAGETGQAWVNKHLTDVPCIRLAHLTFACVVTEAGEAEEDGREVYCGCAPDLGFAPGWEGPYLYVETDGGERVLLAHRPLASRTGAQVYDGAYMVYLFPFAHP